MKLSKKLNTTLILTLVCLILMLSASYAWLTLSVRPEIQGMHTNIGANGSLEIALLTEETYVNPLLIHTAVGDSSVAQDVVASNTSWGNMVALNDERYGLSQIILRPTRLNLTNSGDTLAAGSSLLKTAEYGIDGRIKILSEKTVSTVMQENEFTYYANRQLYGVRAIGPNSNLSAQQTALASSRVLVSTYREGAARIMKSTLRDYGAVLVNLLYKHYALEKDIFNNTTDYGLETLLSFILRTQEAVEYVDAALRQGMIGMAAANISDEAAFEQACGLIYNTQISLFTIASQVGAPTEFVTWARQVDSWKEKLDVEYDNIYWIWTSSYTWDEITSALNTLINPSKTYLGNRLLTDPEAFEALKDVNEILLSPESGIVGELAAYVSNFSAISAWETVNLDFKTTDPNEGSYLHRVETLLNGSQAASGNWTRAKMDDLYGFAIDLAFRCNEPSKLLLQTGGEIRVEDDSEFPVTQGGGSYMRFASENMDTVQLLQLMDVIRVGFLNDRNELLGVAKLNISECQEQEEGIYAPLHLYEYVMDENGRLYLNSRLDDKTEILTLPQNSPTIVTAVVWLDGDSVDSSMVSAFSQQSMSGVLNLQFSSSANLIPSDQIIKNH